MRERPILLKIFTVSKDNALNRINRRSSSRARGVRMRRTAESEACALRMRGAACKQCASQCVLIALCVLSEQLRRASDPDVFVRRAAQELDLIRPER